MSCHFIYRNIQTNTRPPFHQLAGERQLAASNPTSDCGCWALHRAQSKCAMFYDKSLHAALCTSPSPHKKTIASTKTNFSWSDPTKQKPSTKWHKIKSTALTKRKCISLYVWSRCLVFVHLNDSCRWYSFRILQPIFASFCWPSIHRSLALCSSSHFPFFSFSASFK